VSRAAYPGVVTDRVNPPQARDCSPAPDAPLFGLAPGGVCRARPVTRPAGELLPRRFTLTTQVAPRGGLFSVALSLPGTTERWALPTTAPCGVRTFLRRKTGLALHPPRRGPRQRPAAGGERKVRAPQDAVVGNAHRPKPPTTREAAKDRESATESIPPPAREVRVKRWGDLGPLM